MTERRRSPTPPQGPLAAPDRDRPRTATARGASAGGLAWLRRTAAALVVLVAVPAVAPAARGADPSSPTVDLLGTWFVVVHYRDTATANPEADRWEDRVWVFEKKGSRLQWTEYPIVVFDDPSGRFEVRGGNQRARTLVKWMPNESQRAEIAAGPHVNSRGSKTKSLKGSDAAGWESVGGLRAQSANVIGYHESWSIAQPTTRPVFSREDVMGTGRNLKVGSEQEQLEGLTRYTTTEVGADGVLRGRYVRDENRTGEFVMWRAGAVQSLESDGRTPNQKQADRIRDAVGSYVDDLKRRAAEGDAEAARELQELMGSQGGAGR